MPDPFLKWAGGKRWLISRNLLPIPNEFERYVEPFLGSGAVYFALRPHRAVLADLNCELIELYRAIKDSPTAVMKLMQMHQESHSKKYYYEMRDLKPRGRIQRAARTLYLNRTCWNGLYRVNLRGEFNVPKGTKSSVVFDTDDFLSISEALRNATLKCADFEAVIDACTDSDFLFVDPPYTVQHNFNNFLKYNEKIFSWDDQIRLRDAVARAVSRGVAVVLTNADHSAIRKLYDGLARYVRLERHSVLAGDSARRKATSEALFVANIEPQS